MTGGWCRLVGMTRKPMFSMRVDAVVLAGWRGEAEGLGVSVPELVRRRMALSDTGALEVPVVGLGSRPGTGGAVPVSESAGSSGAFSEGRGRDEGVVREPVVRVNTPAVGNPVVASLAASVPGVTVGVDHRARREMGLFDVGCLRGAAHRGGTPCGLCGGDKWV